MIDQGCSVEVFQTSLFSVIIVSSDFNLYSEYSCRRGTRRTRRDMMCLFKIKGEVCVCVTCSC